MRTESYSDGEASRNLHTSDVVDEAYKMAVLYNNWCHYIVPNLSCGPCELMIIRKDEELREQ